MNTFSKKTDKILLVLSIVGLAIGTGLVLFSGNLLYGIQEILENYVFHREFKIEKWADTILSLIAFPIFFVVLFDSIFFVKFSNKTKIILCSVLLGLAIHFFVTLPLFLWVFGKMRNPFALHKAMMPALLMAFSTSSSSATLPVNMECLIENAGVSKRITSFVLPLGATVNMDGTALYECVAAMFIAQAYGIDLSFSTQLIVVTLALFTSIGVAGIPSASLVAIAVILGSIGLPLEGIGLILVVDRVLDMCRTSVNIFSDACCAVVVARTEGETEVLNFAK